MRTVARQEIRRPSTARVIMYVIGCLPFVMPPTVQRAHSARHNLIAFIAFIRFIPLYNRQNLRKKKPHHQAGRKSGGGII